MMKREPYLNPHQARDREPDDYQNLLGDALEEDGLPAYEEAGGHEDADAEVGFVEEHVGLGEEPVA